MDAAPVLLIGALLVGAGVQLILPISRDEPLILAAAKAARPVSPVSPPAPVAADPAILLHPLFNPERAPADSSAGGASAPAGAFMLAGVASTGREAAAIVRDAAGELRTLRLGDSVDGWRLTVVGRDGAILSRGEQSQSLRVGAAAAVPLVRSPTASR